jgi:hypothetical protein
MSRPGRRGLQLDDSPPDPLPKGLPFEVAAFKHQIGAPGRCKLGVGTVLLDQEICGSPDVEVGDHRCEKGVKACPVGCPPDAIRFSRNGNQPGRPATSFRRVDRDRSIRRGVSLPPL